MYGFGTPWRAICLLLITASVGGCLVPYHARSDGVAADSAATEVQVLRAVRADQAAFEEWRRRHLPIRVYPTESRPRCHEPVGRFCLEEGTGYGAWWDLEMKAPIDRERAKLIRALDAVGRRVPEDDWVVGQFVRYTVEAGRIGEAAAAALDCGGTPWWCSALLGYVLHKRGMVAAAERSFDAALREMSPGERERWIDPSPLLAWDDTVSVESMDETSRARFVQRFWRLADPFMTRPGNEVRVEHFARHVELQFQWEAGPTEGLEWGRDMADVVLRYGPPPRRIGAVGAAFNLLGWYFYMGPPRGVPDLMSHYTMPALDLLPSTDILFGGRGVWDSMERVPHAGYDVPVGDSAATWMAPLAHQVAIFHRGEEAVVVAAFDLPSHGFLGEEGGEGALAVLPADDLLLEPEVTPVQVTYGVGVVLERTPIRPAIMSLEAFIPHRHVAGRARRRLDIQPLDPVEKAISDILLVRSSGPAPESLDEAAAVARGSNRVTSGEEVVIFWEMYGVEAAVDSTVTMSLRVVPEESSLLRRFGELIGVAGRPSLARISWEEEITGEAVMARSVALVIPELRDGTHTLELTMEGAGDTATTRAEIVVSNAPIEPLSTRAMTRRPRLTRVLCGAADRASSILRSERNLAASSRYRDLAAQSFSNPLEPPPCPEYLHEVLYETGHGY